jgi:hypothetical protein
MEAFRKHSKTHYQINNILIKNFETFGIFIKLNNFIKNDIG